MMAQTPEMRLRSLAQRLARHRENRLREEREAEARRRLDLQQRSTEVKLTARVWARRLEQLIEATGYPIPWKMTSLGTRDGPGFQLVVGDSHLVAFRVPDGWWFGERRGRVLPSVPVSIAHPEDLRELILEGLVEEGLAVLARHHARPHSTWRQRIMSRSSK